MPMLLRDCGTGRESYFVNRNPIKLPDTAAHTVGLNNSGKLHIVPNLTASQTITLPPAENGLEFSFIYGGVAADAQNFIISTGSNLNFFLGGVVHLDSDAGAAADEIVTVAPNGTTNSKLTIVTPGVGTRIDAICDGTNWYLSGFAVSTAAPTFADQ